jgi:FKBP-type peptidyl-prolyl cis-trans isomerase FkpA
METTNFLFIFLLTALLSCNNTSEKSVNNRKPGKNEIEELNSYFIQKDRERIQNYIERKNLKMKESSSGLWYLILAEGTGAFFKENDRIIMDYNCSLLDGKTCYSSKNLGPKEVILGEGELEAGLNEGLRLLRPGSEAVFILPPFLAYGLVGDGKSIPPRATIVYEIKIVKWK